MDDKSSMVTTRERQKVRFVNPLKTLAILKDKLSCFILIYNGKVLRKDCRVFEPLENCIAQLEWYRGLGIELAVAPFMQGFPSPRSTPQRDLIYSC